MNIFIELKPEWHSKAPEELLDLPPGILKRIDSHQEEALNTVFGIDSIRKMANHAELDWVWRTYRLFRAGVLNEMPEEATEHVTEEWQARGCGEWLRSPAASLKFLNKDQAIQVGRVLGWTTVRDMATDEALEAARSLSRTATGQPTPPEDDVVKPLKNFFQGAASKYRERINAAESSAGRELSGGVGATPVGTAPDAASSDAAPMAAARNGAADPAASPGSSPLAGVRTAASGAPPPPPAAPGSSAGSAPAAPGTPVADLRTSPFVIEPQENLSKLREKNYTPSGAYIPKGGGSRGWYENEGIAKGERGNNYRYSEAIDLSGYKSVGLEHQVFVNMRGAERKEVSLQVRLDLDETTPLPAVCLDVSLTGARVRMGRKLNPGDPLQVTFVHRDDGLGTLKPFLHLGAKVAWCQSVDKRFRVQRFNCGLLFDEMMLGDKERLSKVLLDKIDELLADDSLGEATGE